MSAVESALDVLSRAATMVQGQCEYNLILKILKNVKAKGVDNLDHIRQPQFPRIQDFSWEFYNLDERFQEINIMLSLLSLESSKKKWFLGVESTNDFWINIWNLPNIRVSSVQR